MKTINVSPSRLNTFQKCRWMYYCKYILKLPDEGGDKTRLGSVIHEIFELISRPSKQEQRKKYILHSIETKKLYPSLHRLFQKILNRFKIPVGELRELGEQLLINAFCSGYDIKSKVLDVEKDFHIQVSENVYIKGFIDKILELDDNTLELIDYKSGAPFNDEKCNSEFQPFFYKLAAQKLFPKYKNFLFSFHFLKNKKIITVSKDNEELARFLNFIIAQGILMLNFDLKDANCNTGWHCKWCKFKEPNPELNYTGCPAYFDKNGESRFK